MIFVPGQYVIENVIKGHIGDQPVLNVVYIKKSTGWSLAELEAWAYDLDAYVASAFAGFHHDSYFYDGIYCRELTTADSYVAEHNQATPIGGGLGGDAAPNSIAFCIKFSTGHAGRTRRGRNYVGGLSTASFTDPNHLHPDAAAAMVDFYQGIADLADGDGYHFGVFSRFENKLPRDAGLFTNTAVISYTDLRLDSQRNRMPES